MQRLVIRRPSRRRAISHGVAAAAFVVISCAVLSTPAPLPPPRSASGAPLGAGDLFLLPTVSASSTSATATPSTGSETTRATMTVQPVVAGPPTSGPGIVVVATPLDGDSMSITEIATFSTPQHDLFLRPPQVGYAGIRGLRPVARQVELLVDGVAVDLGTAPLTSTRRIVLGASGATRIELRYVLSGSIVSAGSAGSAGSASGGREVVFQPLLTGNTEAVPVSYVVGGAVVSMSCPQLSLDHQQCNPWGGSVGLLSGLPDDRSLVVVTLAPSVPVTAVTSGSGSDGSTPPSAGPETGGPSTPADGSDPGASTPTPVSTPAPTSTPSPTSADPSDPQTSYPAGGVTSDPPADGAPDPSSTGSPSDGSTEAPGDDSTSTASPSGVPGVPVLPTFPGLPEGQQEPVSTTGSTDSGSAGANAGGDDASAAGASTPDAATTSDLTTTSDVFSAAAPTASPTPP